MNDLPKPERSALRQQLKALRSAQPPTDTSRGALLIRGRLFTWLATRQTEREKQGKARLQNIAAFWSMRDEPTLQPLLEQWVEEQGYTVSLPVVTGKDAPLSFRTWTPGDSLTEGPYGMKEPTGQPAPVPDIVLVPTLGFTRQGHRIGYGGGYYDRTLASLRASGASPICLGVAWAVGDLTDLAPDYQPAPHDQALDGILTDKGWPMPPPDL